MPDRYAQIRSLYRYARTQLDEISNGYPHASNAPIPETLAIKTKNYLENLRSIFDYIAFDICQSILGLSNHHKCYFPIACKDALSFAKHMARNFPQLQQKDPILYAELERIQQYHKGDLQDLAKLSALVNANKHRELTKQETRVSKHPFSKFKIVRLGELKDLDPKADGCDGYMVVDETRTSDDLCSSDLVLQNIGKVIQIDPEQGLYTSYHFATTGDDVIALLLRCSSDTEKLLSRFKELLYDRYS